MDYNEAYQLAQTLHKNQREWRGRILNHAAVIEYNLSLIITAYFSKETKATIFFGEIVWNSFFTFGAKKKIFENIIKRDFSFLLERSDPLNIFSALDEIIKFRNEWAHSILDVSDEALMNSNKNIVTLIFYKNGKQIIKQYNQNDINNWECKMNMVSSFLSETKSLLKIPKELEPKR